MLPLADAGMVAVRDRRHGRALLEGHGVPQLGVPAAGGVFPRVIVYPDGVAEPGVGSDQLTELTRRAAFRPSLETLAAFADPPAGVARRLARLAGSDPLLGPGGNAVAAVEACIAACRHEDLEFRRQCVAAWRRESASAPV